MRMKADYLVLFFCMLVLPGSFSCSSPSARGGVVHRDSTAAPAPKPAGLPSGVVYTSSDSVEIVRLLAAVPHDLPADSVLLRFARHFLGRPYVGQTLEQNAEERLVVNLCGLDCTTLVETVSALALTHFSGEDSFAAFCRNLERLRYFDGRRSGYCSRLHYFGWWIADNCRRRLVEEVALPDSLTVPFTWSMSFMSAHPDKYKHLAGQPARVDSIRRIEKRYNGRSVRILPKQRTSLPRNVLSMVRDGDIIAIATSKRGLDYAHLGFAVWGSDGKLHLLNASSLYKKVVEDEVPLSRYLAAHASFVGIQLFRLSDRP